MQDFCTSYKAANSQPVNKHIVNQLAACKQFSYHIQIGSDRSGCIQHGLDTTIHYTVLQTGRKQESAINTDTLMYNMPLGED